MRFRNTDGPVDTDRRDDELTAGPRRGEQPATDPDGETPTHRMHGDDGRTVEGDRREFDGDDRIGDGDPRDRDRDRDMLDGDPRDDHGLGSDEGRPLSAAHDQGVDRDGTDRHAATAAVHGPAGDHGEGALHPTTADHAVGVARVPHGPDEPAVGHEPQAGAIGHGEPQAGTVGHGEPQAGTMGNQGALAGGPHAETAPGRDGSRDEAGLMPGTLPEQPVPAAWDADSAERFRGRWRDVQVRFLDDPRGAAEEADSLLDEVVTALTQALSRQRDDLRTWRDTERGDTEELRMAVRRYRDMLDRLLAF